MKTTSKTTELNRRKVILSTLWIFAMFNYVYADILTLYFNPVLQAAVAFSLTGPLYWNLFYVFFSTIEIACTVFIIWYAWTWPHPEGEVLRSAQSSVYEQRERGASFSRACGRVNRQAMVRWCVGPSRVEIDDPA
jgi:hypothetical protein